jgi:hypothetical protein
MRLLGLIVALLLTSAGVAHAQYNVPAPVTGDTQYELATSDRTRGYQQDVQLAQDEPGLGWEVGAGLDFLTRDRLPGGEPLKFTDVVLFRVHGLLSLGRRSELFAGVDLLAKQPSYTDELLWQGALLGARTTVNHWLAGYARVQGGPGLARDGYWGMGEVALQSKVDLAERMLFWDSTLGGTYTHLVPDGAGGDTRAHVWQTELLAQTGLSFREHRGFFAMWLTFGFHFPLASSPEIDPQTRVDVQLGMLLGVTKKLDLFIETAIFDRGDLQDARTTLPILSGGFDQRRILFGFNRRFGGRQR